ncbi:MAG: hypothetical protein ABW189_06525 [Rickettsiales bacterium]
MKKTFIADMDGEFDLQSKDGFGTVFVGAENSCKDGMPRPVSACFFMPDCILRSGVDEIRRFCRANKSAVSLHGFQLPSANTENVVVRFLMKESKEAYHAIYFICPRAI